jgi:uncharacterized OsmC-like protein
MRGSERGDEPQRETDLDRRLEVRTGRDRYRSDVAVRGHLMVVDEPETLGGSDMGPTPYELICAALGTCTTITLRMYADRKAWPLEEVIATVTYHRSRSDPESGGEAEDVFRVELDFRGALDEPQRRRLFEIATRCPVHRTLVAGARIETSAGHEP